MVSSSQDHAPRAGDGDGSLPVPPADMRCNLCRAGGLLPPHYNPRERTCSFPNNGDFAYGGWGCVTEDMLCEVLRRDNAKFIERLHLGQDMNASFFRCWEAFGEDAQPVAVWATWYKSRGNFQQLVAMGWNEEDPSRPLSYVQAIEILRSSHATMEHRALLAKALIPAGGASSASITDASQASGMNP